jgi:hypothetical protein
MRGGDAAHVVFGGLAAEEHDEVFLATAHVSDGTRHRR